MPHRQGGQRLHLHRGAGQLRPRSRVSVVLLLLLAAACGGEGGGAAGEAASGDGGGTPDPDGADSTAAALLVTTSGEEITDPRLSGWEAGGDFRLSPVHAAAVDTARLPGPLTPALVREGGAVFHGAGGCHVCHGEAATGARGVGADLTDDEWLHSGGSWEEIVRQVRSGVGQEETRSPWGAVMPPLGGRDITEDQVRAVAAYVWSLRLFDPPPEPEQDVPG